MTRVGLVAAALFGLWQASAAEAARRHPAHHAKAQASLTKDAIDNAAPDGRNGDDPALVVKAEVLLGRRNFSPGVIDGRSGTNYRKALAAFQQTQNLVPSAKLDPDTWSALTANVSDPVIEDYTISDADLAGPFVARVPTDLTKMAQLPGLSYKNPVEELAEKFHMSERLLHELNPGAHFDRAGAGIVVLAVQPMDLRRKHDTIEEVPPPKKSDPGAASVATIVVDKPARTVRAYDQAGKLLAFYPATIGSQEKPAPSGTFEVRRVAWNPAYHYDPKFAWKGVKTRQKLTVKPGPNNPVGLVWIDLSAPSYGIHGTPEPNNIGKTESHGCIRLTNWDAVALGAMVHKGTAVRFEDQDSPVVLQPNSQSAGTGSAAAAGKP